MFTRLIAGALALAVFAVLVVAADARPRHHQKYGEPYGRPISCDQDGRCTGGGAMPEFSSILPTVTRLARTIIHDARPRAWCGWYARHELVSTDPGIAYNLARNWAHWGRPASPGPNVIVVWPHHVGMITGKAPNGQWIVKSGNDGNSVRERPRSVRGAIAFRAG